MHSRIVTVLSLLSLNSINGFHVPVTNPTAVGRKKSFDPSMSIRNNRSFGDVSIQQLHQEERKEATKLFDDQNNGNSESNSQLSSPFDKPILATLDFVSLMVFAGVGKASHSADGSLDIGAVLITAFPFLVSWFATSPLTGIYDNTLSGREGESNIFIDAAKVTAKGWILAVPLGCIGRGLIKGYVPPLPFVIVTLIATLVILTSVRLLYTGIENKVVAE